ncbi:MAG: futalosine hydrolase [Bacteroidota bacterium]
MEQVNPPFRILIVAATPFEIAPLQDYLREHFEQLDTQVYQKEQLQVALLVTGVGLTHTALSLGRVLQPGSTGLAINAGVAGAFHRDLELGQVVNVVTERFGDLGVEEADGRFTDLHQLGLLSPDAAPFQFGVLHNPTQESSFLTPVHGLSVNKVHGYPPSIAAIQQKYGSDIESMEGAAFFLACLQVGVPFLEIRAISNYVEARNRENWRLDLAIAQLNKVLIGMLEELVVRF